MLALLLVGLLIGVAAERVGAITSLDTSRQSSESRLSSYWSYNIRRWESLIVQEADRRSLDPDFLAALVWQESRGDATAVGPKGAVGLMQVMPKEAGFTWRPSKEALLDPNINVFWGTRTLATVIHQGSGDVFHALAAYNGGWEQTTYRRPRAFAMTILRDYAHAVAYRSGVPGRWVAYFAVKDAYIRGPIWVADSARQDVYFFGQDNVLPDGALLVPARAATSLVARCVSDDDGMAYDVGIWLYSVEQHTWYGPDAAPAAIAAVASTATPALVSTATPFPASPTPPVPPAPSPVVTVTPSPTTTPTAWPQTTVTPGGVAARVRKGQADIRPGATRWWNSSTTLPKDTALDVLGYDPASPDWVYVRTLDQSVSGWMQIKDLELFLPVNSLPLITPIPTLTPTTTATTTPTPTPTIACTGEALWAEAWALEKSRNPTGGWSVVIYAKGHGGNCMYTYAWNVDFEQGPTTDAVIFRMTMDRLEPLLGTVIVTSGDERTSVGIYVLPPQ